MGRIITLGGRSDAPTAPYEIQDEVEMWARGRDRSAKVVFAPTKLGPGGQILAGTWLVRLSLRANDRRMQLHQQGLAPEPPTENVWLHRSPTRDEVARGVCRSDDFIPLDIYQMGPSGVRAFLERGDTWSGRGEYSSIEDELRQKREANARLKQEHREKQKVENRYEQRDKRRSRLKIPFLPVGVSLKKPAD